MSVATEIINKKNSEKKKIKKRLWSDRQIEQDGDEIILPQRKKIGKIFEINVIGEPVQSQKKRDQVQVSNEKKPKAKSKGTST